MRLVLFFAWQNAHLAYSCSPLAASPAQLPGTTANPTATAARGNESRLRIINSVCSFSVRLRARYRGVIVVVPPLLSPQRWVSVDINPIGSSRRHMTGQTIRPVVGRRRLGRVASIEPRPTPAVAPQLVA